jgi:hypothetical protein
LTSYPGAYSNDIIAEPAFNEKETAAVLRAFAESCARGEKSAWAEVWLILRRGPKWRERRREHADDEASPASLARSKRLRSAKRGI